MACQFDRLSDCILLTLLEKLDATSLYQLSRVNTRFQGLALETSLWKKIDARRAPNDEKKINYILDRVHESTDMLLLKGRRAYPRVIELMQLNTFSKLTILALENQIICQSMGVKLSDFPKSLVELSFKNSFFESSSEFFRKAFGAMENLKVLIIDGCSNVSCSVIMSVSKYPNLEIFSCYKCPIENSVAYFSIAVSNGFKKIKVFDVRLSGLGNTFLSSMLKKSNIVMLYFQNKDTSYELDFQNRAEEALSQNLPIPKYQFRALPVTGNVENLVTDFGTLEFSRTAFNYEEHKIPKSFLYEYPYPPCTCGFKGRREELKMSIDDGESNQLKTFRQEDERNLIEIIKEEDFSDDETILDMENCNGDGYLERGNNIVNSSTEIAQLSDNTVEPKAKTSKGTSTSSASDVNSQLDAQNKNESHPSRTCTEIIYSVFSKKKRTKNKSVGTNSTNKTSRKVPDDDQMDSRSPQDHAIHGVTSNLNNSQDLPNDSIASNVNISLDQSHDRVTSNWNNSQDQPNDCVTSNLNNIQDQSHDSVILNTDVSTSNLNDSQDNPHDGITIDTNVSLVQSNNCVTSKLNDSQDQPNDCVTSNVNNSREQPFDCVTSNSNTSLDLPSTSGLSVPLRKRKLSNVKEEGVKNAKRNKAASGESCSSSDDGEDRDLQFDPRIPCPLPHSERGTLDQDRRRSDGQILYISRGSASSKRISDAVTSYLNDRSRRVTESNEGSSNDPSTSRARRRDVALVECRARNNAQPARTQVYPCACGNHSVIVVTADETEEGDGPPLNPPENHFHPRHCEQRINLNSHQSLRVINRNANVFARPEIELVEIKKDKSLKCGLRQISFRGYQKITDLTLKNVGHLHLELLDVTYTQCTKKGILDFLRINPNCRVLHKDFCLCKPRLDF